MNTKAIPFFSLNRQTELLKTTILNSFEELLTTQQFIGGSSITGIEEQLADYLGVKHVITCNSGTDALWIAIKALNIQPGDIVLTSPFSFIASSSELIPHGAFPVFIDCEKDSFNIDPYILRKWLEAETSMINGKTVHTTTGAPVVGIIPVHMFGQCVNYNAIQSIAKQYNLWIIEDTAQAIGSEYNGKKAGSMADIGTFSFYPTKNLGAYGDAGCCATNDSILAESLLKLRNHGRKSHYFYEEYGLNSRMDALQAVVIGEKLNHIDTYNEQRRALANIYHQRLKHLTYLTLPQEKYGTHTYHQFSVLIHAEQGITRDKVAEHLASHGIETRVFYPQTLQEIAYLNENKALATSCPQATAITQSILSLPIWPELTHDELNYICDTLEQLAITTFHSPQQGLQETHV